MTAPTMVTQNGEPVALAELARRAGVHRDALASRWKRAGRPEEVPEDSELLKPTGWYGKPVIIKLDGEEMTVAMACKKTGVTAATIHSRIREYRTHNLTTDDICRRKKYGGSAGEKAAPSQRRYMSVVNTRAERERLARIPGPTPWELKLWGDRV